jgi:hypothetical protein
LNLRDPSNDRGCIAHIAARKPIALTADCSKRVLIGWLRGKRDHCHVTAIPTQEEIDAKRSNREREGAGTRTQAHCGPNKEQPGALRCPKLHVMLRKAPQHLSMLYTPEGMPSSAKYPSHTKPRRDVAATAIRPTPYKAGSAFTHATDRTRGLPGAGAVAGTVPHGKARPRHGAHPFRKFASRAKLLGHLANLRCVASQASCLIVGHSAFLSSGRTSGSPNA